MSDDVLVNELRKCKPGDSIVWDEADGTVFRIKLIRRHKKEGAKGSVDGAG